MDRRRNESSSINQSIDGSTKKWIEFNQSINQSNVGTDKWEKSFLLTLTFHSRFRVPSAWSSVFGYDSGFAPAFSRVFLPPPSTPWLAALALPAASASPSIRQPSRLTWYACYGKRKIFSLAWIIFRKKLWRKGGIPVGQFRFCQRQLLPQGWLFVTEQLHFPLHCRVIFPQLLVTRLWWSQIQHLAEKKFRRSPFEVVKSWNFWRFSNLERLSFVSFSWAFSRLMSRSFCSRLAKVNRRRSNS